MKIIYSYPQRIFHVVFLLAGLLILTSQPLHAKTTCQRTPQGELCLSEVDFQSFAQQAYDTQKASQWCWAASVSMLFSYYKHPVSQQRIVQDAYGSIVNMPAVSGIVIARQINREWVDGNNKKFAAQLTSAYDYDARVYNTNNMVLINELDQNRPFIMGTNNHAVVATAMQYYRTQYGPNVVAVGVFDPLPGRGARGLTAPEMTPMHMGGGLRFIATVKVTDYK